MDLFETVAKIEAVYVRLASYRDVAGGAKPADPVARQHRADGRNEMLEPTITRAPGEAPIRGQLSRPNDRAWVRTVRRREYRLGQVVPAPT